MGNTSIDVAGIQGGSHVDAEAAGVRFLSRATNNRYLTDVDEAVSQWKVRPEWSRTLFRT